MQFLVFDISYYYKSLPDQLVTNLDCVQTYIYLQLAFISSFFFQGIEDLCTKRDELQKQILNEEEEKAKIQNDIRILTEKLSKVNESLSRKIASRNEYDKTIAETEAAYMKVRDILRIC